MKENYARINCKITLNGESFDLSLTSTELTPSGVVFKTGSDLLFLGGVAATILAATHGSPVNAAINGILATGILLAGSTKLLNLGKYNYSAIDGYRINHKINEYYKKMRALEVQKLNSNDPQIFEEKQKELAIDTVNFLEKEYEKSSKIVEKLKDIDKKEKPFEGPVFSSALDNKRGITKFVHYNKEYLSNAVPSKIYFLEQTSSHYHSSFDYNLPIIGALEVKDDTIKNEELINKTSKNNANDREI